MEREYDVLVIGGCSAGLYFAAGMARQGYRTLVIEKDGKQALGRRYDIFHLARSTFSRFGIAEPKENEACYAGSFPRSASRSALDNYPKISSKEEFMVLHRHEFMIRLEKRAETDGVTVLHEAEFKSPVFDASGRLSGAEIEYKAEKHFITARLVADASGIPSVVRTSLPDDYGVENFGLGPKDKFFVVLYYAGLDNPQRDRLKGETCGWPYYKTWIAPQQDPDGVILGVGANLSYDYAEKCFADFAKLIKLPPHKVNHTEKGCTPYRRPPYSLVGDGFIALGDAACITNPWNGEGVTAAWLQAEIAAEEAGEAMKNGSYPDRESLWKINTRYYASQGADYAQLLSMLAGVIDCTPEENDYEFKNSIIFKGDDETASGSMFGKILKGVVTGNLKIRTLYRIAAAAVNGGKILKHYKKYPDRPADFTTWKKKADSLWRKTRSVSDLTERDLKKQSI